MSARPDETRAERNQRQRDERIAVRAKEYEERISHRADEIDEELKFISDRMSTLSRGVGYALAALAYVLPISSSEFAQQIIRQHRWWLLSASVLGVTTLILDYVQYLVSYVSNKDSMNKPPPSGNRLHDDAGGLFLLTRWMFLLKHLVAFLGILVFVTLWLFVLFFDQPSGAVPSYLTLSPG